MVRRSPLAVALLVAACAPRAPDPTPPASAIEPPVVVAPSTILAPSAAASTKAGEPDRCPFGEMRLVSDDPARSSPQELLRLRGSGEIVLAIAPSTKIFALDPAGCLTAQGKLVAEMLPDGRILSVAGEERGALRANELVLRHSRMVIGADGSVTQDPSPGLPPWRVEGFDPDERCAAAMMIIALGESAAGASMAVVDGVAKRPAPAPPPPGSRCEHVPR